MKRVVFSVAVVPVAVLCAGLTLTACSTHAPDKYSRQEMGKAMTVQRGVVMNVREVKVEGTSSGIGAGAGAAAGGVGGYQIGGNQTVNILGAIGGAVIGGLIGAAAESGLTSDTAQEVLVQLDSGKVVAYVQKSDDPEALRVGDKVVVLEGEKTRVIRDATAPSAPTPAPVSAPAPASTSAPESSAVPEAAPTPVSTPTP